MRLWGELPRFVALSGTCVRKSFPPRCSSKNGRNRSCRFLRISDSGLRRTLRRFPLGASGPSGHLRADAMAEAASVSGQPLSDSGYQSRWERHKAVRDWSPQLVVLWISARGSFECDFVQPHCRRLARTRLSHTAICGTCYQVAAGREPPRLPCLDSPAFGPGRLRKTVSLILAESIGAAYVPAAIDRSTARIAHQRGAPECP